MKRVALLGAVLLCLGANTAYANGRPVQVYLSYLPGVSNWGPQNGTGFAEINLGEGEVTLNVANLPRLEGEEYTAWLVNSSTGARLQVARFNVNERGYGFSHNFVDADLKGQEFDLVMVVAGADPAGRRSIAGYFPAPDQPVQRPARLPNTGGPAPEPMLSPVLMGTATLLAVVGIAITARRRGR